MTWHNPDAPYTGPVDADLSHLADPFKALAAVFTFTDDAKAHDRPTMRTRWREQRYPDMPRTLAAQIIDDVELAKEGK